MSQLEVDKVIPQSGTTLTLGESGDTITIPSGATFSATLTAPVIDEINDNNGNEEIIFTTTASAVNELTIANAATGNAPEIAATGSDTNIDLKLTPKGSGKLVLDGLAFPNADGSANQVLQTNGSGVLSFATPSSDYVLLSTTTAAGTATSLDITSNINSTYSIYRLSFFNVSAAGAGNTIFLRISDDGGSTFKSSGYKHTGLTMEYTGSVVTQNDEASAGFVQISNNLPNYNDNTTEGACGFVEFYTPSVSRKAVFTGMTAQIDDSGNGDATYWGGVYTTAIIFNAIRIAASNNIYGTFKLYGIK